MQTKVSSVVDARRANVRKLSITAVILTFNEEIHIHRCLTCIGPLVERIVIVDSFSTDRTVEIATGLGAFVQQRGFKHQADQFQWALENCGINTDWVLRLDADEYLEELLQEEICTRLPSLPRKVTGLEFRLKVIFKGQWIKFGGYYRTNLLRMWRNGEAAYEQRWMDEKIFLRSGESLLLRNGDLVDENLKDIGWWTDKHNRYATRQMVDFIGLEYGLWIPENHAGTKAGMHNRLKRFLRNKVFAKSPLYLRSAIYFFYRYFIRCGFLDGRQGFVWHFLHGFWFFVLIDAKIDEGRSFIKRHGSEAFKKHLKTRHNIEL